MVFIHYAYSIGLIVFQQKGSCLHFRVDRVFIGALSHVPYCRKLNMAQCRVQCGHPTINEVTCLLVGKIIQAVLFEYLPQIALFCLNLEKFGHQRFDECCLDLD
jgi:hypothetical protein